MMATEHDYDISVLGAGSYGTALAVSLARNGHRTLLWGHEPEHIDELARDRVNQAFLPDVALPELLDVTADIGAATRASANLLLVVPSFAFGDVLDRIAPHLRNDSRICWATKGLEADTGRLLHEVARDHLGDAYPLAVISGPTFAMEVARGLPTAIAVAATDDDFADTIAQLLHSEHHLRVYRNHDFVGLQLGGAVKNVLAIAAGMADGLGFGANARTALITRGLAEMTRLGEALGAQPGTFMGMAGLGDLVLTCTDNQSRNRRFGIALGQGQSREHAEQAIGQVVEGFRNTKEVYVLAQRLGVEMPIVEQVYAVLYQGADPIAAAKALLARTAKHE